MAKVADDSDKTLDRLREMVESRRCSNHSCIWGHRGGMGTNGPCRHATMSVVEARRELRQIAKELREILDGIPD